MAQDSFLPVLDAAGVTRKVANLQTVNANADTVEMQRTADYYNASEYLADQSGNGTVLDFTFTSAVQVIYVRAIGGIARVGVGATPSASAGAYVGADETFAIPRNASSIKVYAPTGTNVAVWGYRY